MSSSSRRTNRDNDHSAPHGSGRSLSSVRRTSSQPPQTFQPSATVSGTYSGTADSVPWANHPPSNVQGTAPGQAPHLYVNQTRPSGDDWDFMNLTSQLTDSAQFQTTSSHQVQPTVPELYPFASFTSTPGGQYDNPQSRDRLSSLQRSITSSGNTRDSSSSHTSLQPTSPLPQPRTTSVPREVLYATQPQYHQLRNSDPQNHPQQRRQQQQQQPPAPEPHNNQYFSDQLLSPPQPLVSPNTSQEAPLYTTQYNPPPSSAQYTRAHDIGGRSVAHPSQPSPNMGRWDASIRPTGPGGSEGTSNDWGYHSGGTVSNSTVPRTAPLSTQQPVVVPNIRQQGMRPPAQAAVAAATVHTARRPTCLIPGCRNQVAKDVRTGELAEYCGEAHTMEALQTFGVLVCPACNKFPRRSNREYCGSSCERWAAQQLQLQQQRQGQQQQQQQQRQQQQRQQRRG